MGRIFNQPTQPTSTCFTCRKIYFVGKQDKGECYDCELDFISKQMILYRKPHNMKCKRITRKMSQQDKVQILELLKKYRFDFKERYKFALFCQTHGVSLSMPVIVREIRSYWNDKNFYEQND